MSGFEIFSLALDLDADGEDNLVAWLVAIFTDSIILFLDIKFFHIQIQISYYQNGLLTEFKLRPQKLRFSSLSVGRDVKVRNLRSTDACFPLFWFNLIVLKICALQTML